MMDCNPTVTERTPATKVPDAEFLSYEQGGHLLLLQLDEVREKMATFYERHTGDA